jgi:hypothetical protein
MTFTAQMEAEPTLFSHRVSQVRPDREPFWPTVAAAMALPGVTGVCVLAACAPTLSTPSFLLPTNSLHLTCTSALALVPFDILHPALMVFFSNLRRVYRTLN